MKYALMCMLSAFNGELILWRIIKIVGYLHQVNSRANYQELAKERPQGLAQGHLHIFLSSL